MIAILLYLGLSLSAHAQSGIGSWNDYLPYKEAVVLCPFNSKILIGTENALFSVNRQGGELQKINKIHGLSDIGISALNSNGQLAIVGYKNGNIDLIEEGSIFNLPDLKNENIIGTKRINSILFDSKFAYLCCPFGIIQVNLPNKEISNTFYLNSAGNINVNQVGVYMDSLFAATDSGLYRAALHSNLSDYNNWQKPPFIDSLQVKDLGTVNNQLYYTTGDSLFCYSKVNAITPINTTSYLETVGEELYLLTPSKGYLVRDDGIIEKYSGDLIQWTSDIYSEGDTTWFADNANGLVKKINETWNRWQ